MIARPSTATSVLRALLVEEDHDLAQVVRTPLLKAGLQCEHIVNCQSGLAKFQSYEPHVVLLSLGLPRIGGVALCPEIRAQSSVPITILSVRTRKEDHLHALNLGADDFIVIRPFDEQLLVARVLTLLRRAYHYGQAQAPIIQNPKSSDTLIMSTTRGETPAGWVTCEACGYMGPQHRFEQLDARGQKMANCPHCNQEQNLRFTIS